MNLCHTVIDSPIGPMLLVADGDALSAVWMGKPHRGQDAGPEVSLDEAPAVLRETARQLGEYFAGTRASFDLPTAPGGTDFQRRVWAALATIPYGEVRTYGQIAAQIGQPRASQAVGAANGRNPLSIVVPCHRVVGSDGTLTGYAGGLDRKRTLLDLERTHRTE